MIGGGQAPEGGSGHDQVTGWLRELLASARRRLDEIYGNRLRGLYLFGSYARGEAGAGSDVDLLIVLDEIGHYVGEVERTSPITSDLSLHYDVSISRIFVSEADWLASEGPFLVNVRRDSIAA